MTNHYTRIGQEKLLYSLMLECNDLKHSEPKNNLSDYQLMLKINDYLIKLNLTPYTEEELEMDLK